ncbi:MAG: hypothetical protein H6669_07455 [Ardenticatenaceae bacterium]|nr:hypothetical protein [Ardenticatenaceae bacterium]
MIDAVAGSLAQAFYFLLWGVAQIFWEVNRSLISIAILTYSVNEWILENIGYFVEAVVNALEGPLAIMIVLAVAALGFWYLLNSIVATQKIVDPSKLLINGFLVLFFFGSPIVAIEALEGLRTSVMVGISSAVMTGTSGNILDTGLSGNDDGLPALIPDYLGDGVVDSFDLAAAFMLLSNANEFDSIEFPADFETTYFSGGDPTSIDLTDEAAREQALADAWEGIKRLATAEVIIPTAIAEYLLRLALTGAAVLLYIGVPFAMLLAFFVYTQAFFASYVRQFINLIIETFISFIIVSLMVTILALASQEGIGLYIGASIVTFIVIAWRIKSAFKLAMGAMDLFGGASITGGSSGRDLYNSVAGVAGAGAGLALAAATGGSALALAGGLSAAAQSQGMGNDPAVQGRDRQLKAIAGYAVGKSKTLSGIIENTHEARTFARNFKTGGMGYNEPDTLDYLRVGQTLSAKGSSPWVAMGLSSSLRDAYDDIGGRPRRGSRSEVGDPDEMGEKEQATDRPAEAAATGNGSGRSANGPSAVPGESLSSDIRNLQATVQDLIKALTDPGAFAEDGKTNGTSSGRSAGMPGEKPAQLETDSESTAVKDNTGDKSGTATKTGDQGEGSQGEAVPAADRRSDEPATPAEPGQPQPVVITGANEDGDEQADSVPIAESLDRQPDDNPQPAAADDELLSPDESSDDLRRVIIASVEDGGLAGESESANSNASDEPATPAEPGQPQPVIIVGADGDGDGLVDSAPLADALYQTSPAADEPQPVIITGADSDRDGLVDSTSLADAISKDVPETAVDEPTAPDDAETSTAYPVSHTIRVTAAVEEPAAPTTPPEGTSPPFTAPSVPGSASIVLPASSKGPVQEAVVNLVTEMASSDTGRARVAHTEIAQYAGPQTADTLQEAALQHGPANIQLAVEATTQLVEQHAAEGATASEILHQFQIGAAAEAIRDQTGIEQLTNDQVAAVADALLMPRRVLDKEELTAAIAETMASGYTSDAALSAHIGTPINFGGDTGSIRAVMEGAREMSLGQADMERLTFMILDGLKQEVRAELEKAGHNRMVVDDFVNGLDSLPESIQVPQTAAFGPGDVAGFQRFTKKVAK